MHKKSSTWSGIQNSFIRVISETFGWIQLVFHKHQYIRKTHTHTYERIEEPSSYWFTLSSFHILKWGSNKLIQNYKQLSNKHLNIQTVMHRMLLLTRLFFFFFWNIDTMHDARGRETECYLHTQNAGTQEDRPTIKESYIDSTINSFFLHRFISRWAARNPIPATTLSASHP